MVRIGVKFHDGTQLLDATLDLQEVSQGVYNIVDNSFPPTQYNESLGMYETGDGVSEFDEVAQCLGVGTCVDWGDVQINLDKGEIRAKSMSSLVRALGQARFAYYNLDEV